MELPSAYFSRVSRPVQGQERRGAIIDVHGEKFTPWPNELIRHSRHGPFMWILVSGHATLDRVVEARIQLATKNLEGKVSYGLSFPLITVPVKLAFSSKDWEFWYGPEALFR